VLFCAVLEKSHFQIPANGLVFAASRRSEFSPAFKAGIEEVFLDLRRVSDD
jgi:hypothetical protein